MQTKPDYKETLNLPKTSFPMKANLVNREPEKIEFWNKIDLYALMQEKRKGCKKFILNDGPPYANGDIHIGHTLNKILKDIIVKSKHLSGYKAPYIPGWDCHGLPIEVQVEKKLGKSGMQMDPKVFREKCRAFAKEQIDIQRKSFIRLGVLGDWYNPYITMDYQFEADVVRALGKVIANGHLQKGDKPVHWCINCASALAEAEVEYKDKESPSIDIAFRVVDENAVIKKFKLTDRGNGSISVIIWTTTPWTLPANQAVTVHHKLTYVLLQGKESRLIIAEALLDMFTKRVGEEYKVIGTCTGGELEHVLLQHPFCERLVPIILGEHVTTDAGTGCVHTAPAHGYEDYFICKHYNLPMNNPVLANGCFMDDEPFVGGMRVFKANDVVIELLKNKGALLSCDKIMHSYPHCWRHKTPLIFRATPQWFVSMDKLGLREKSLNAIKQVKWIPDWGQARIEAMIKNRPDWCISRQRIWGTPMSLFVHKETGEMHPKSVELMEKIANIYEKSGGDAWYDIDVKDLLMEDARDYEKLNDTLDVWFDSGVVHACVAAKNPELMHPVDLYSEGSDQHRGWFQTSLLTSIAINDQAPYKQVLTHGFTVDKDGHKMSKSLGNVVAPDKVIKTLGADILRLWIAATDYRHELHVSDEILKRISDAYRRIRNTARFLLANLHDFDPKKDIIPSRNMLMLDRWIVDKARQLQQIMLDAYETYRFHVIYQEIHNFCVNELGSFYLDIIKDRQYTCKETGIPRRSAQTAIYHVVEAFVRWIAPILSFTAEEIWQYMPGERAKSVFLTDWYKDLSALDEKEQMNGEFWEQILSVRSAVNKILEDMRNDGIIGSALEAEVELYCSDELYKNLELLGEELKFVLITSSASIHKLSLAADDSSITDFQGLKLRIHKSEHAKCERCWHRTIDVNQNSKFPDICLRCVDNLTKGETRKYA